jgi:acetyl-CoA carboxylase alpha subunit
VGDIREKAQLTVEIQKLREKRSKLQRKLGDPKAAVSRKAVWQVQLAQAQASIDELSTRRSLI